MDCAIPFASSPQRLTDRLSPLAAVLPWRRVPVRHVPVLGDAAVQAGRAGIHGYRGKVSVGCWGESADPCVFCFLSQVKLTDRQLKGDVA
jgi:hypothetical protein